jgi:hypothetical protein
VVRQRSVRCLRSVLDVGHGWLRYVEVVRETMMSDDPATLRKCYKGDSLLAVIVASVFRYSL